MDADRQPGDPEQVPPDLLTPRTIAHPGLAPGSQVLPGGDIQAAHDDLLMLVIGQVVMLPPPGAYTRGFIDGACRALCWVLGHGTNHGGHFEEWLAGLREDLEAAGCVYVSAEEYHRMVERGEL